MCVCVGGVIYGNFSASLELGAYNIFQMRRIMASLGATGSHLFSVPPLNEAIPVAVQVSSKDIAFQVPSKSTYDKILQKIPNFYLPVGVQ